MKTIPPPCPVPETGPKYWRSLDQLADSPEFRQMVEREFPAGASELNDPQTRRYFLKIMSASMGLAGIGLTGCRKPEEYIYPFSRMPEGYVHGVARYYASSMPTQTGAIPLLVKSNEGRPTKIEGNPTHPDSGGATDTFAQATILNLYDPDRATRFTNNGSGASREAAFDFLGQVSAKFQANGGQGLRFLADRTSSPSRLRLQGIIAQKFPQAVWHTYEAVNFGVYEQAAQIAFGQPLHVYPRLGEAKVVLSLDNDFLGLEDDSSRHVRGFAGRRRVKDSADATQRLNRLYSVESILSLTGMNADHRLRVAPSGVAKVAAQVAAAVLAQAGGAAAGLASVAQQMGQGGPASAKWVEACAKDLLAHKGQCLVLAGHRQPLAVHVLALALNAALDNVGKTLVFHKAPEVKESSITTLAQALNSDQVDTLVILGGNPVYNAPADLNWAAAQAKAKTVVRYGYYVDETSAASQWHIPAAHFLESWGDARTSDGTLVPVQPLIEPLFGGITDLEVLARIAGHTKTSAYDVTRETFALTASTETEDRWRKFLHDGFLAGTAAPAQAVSFNAGAVGQFFNANPLPAAAQGLEVVFQADYRVGDGFYANNGWLQELPDPITKMVWENVILLSPATARTLNVEARDREDLNTTAPIIRIEVGGRQIEGPAWVQPGFADNTLGVTLGYGRSKAGRIGNGLGYDAYKIRPAASAGFVTGAKLTLTGRKHPLASTQNHWSMEGRPVIREANLAQYQKRADFAKTMDFPAAPVMKPLYPNPLDAVKPSAIHQWGMVIDLNACVGCTSCMVACQSENNIPIVGKGQVRKSREMHWLRIDRYYTGSIEDPQVVNQPMLCQHCEAAPCENVCPVNATVHDHEGLNVMAYNRCVGTRYCSNNCPYKVRRFNYFDYNKRPIDKLYFGPLASRPKDEMDIIALAKNPDVTVRMRGVMEKCTFCVQRIETAKISQKVKAKATADVEVPDGTFTTACAQACPAGAITFGNIANPNSQVSAQKKSDRDYTVLEFLATKPRLTYLAKVRNPNPEMPDYQELPLSMQEYAEKMGGNPLEAHHGSTHETAPAGGAHAEQKGAH